MMQNFGLEDLSHVQSWCNLLKYLVQVKMASDWFTRIYRWLYRINFLQNRDMACKLGCGLFLSPQLELTWTFSLFYWQIYFTVKLRKPWTPTMQCYCVARSTTRKQNHKQKLTVISLWFWDLLTCPELSCDRSLNNQQSCNISGIHNFPSLAVNFLKMGGFRKYPYLPQGWFSCSYLPIPPLPPPPAGISSFASYFPLKSLAFETQWPSLGWICIFSGTTPFVYCNMILLHCRWKWRVIIAVNFLI